MEGKRKEFTIEDVDQWLGCDKQAEIKIWQDSGFFVAMAYKSIGVCRKSGWTLTLQDADKMDVKEINDIYLSAAMSAVQEVFFSCKWGKRPKKPGEFKYTGKFINYVKKTAKYRLCPPVPATREIPIDAPVRNRNNEETENTGHDIIPGAPGAEYTAVSRLAQTKVKQQTAIVIEAFSQYLTDNARLSEANTYLEILRITLKTRWEEIHRLPTDRQLADKKLDISVDLFRFLDNMRNAILTDLRDIFRHESDYHQSTFDSKNRRLRAQFTKYKLTSGRKEYQLLMELKYHERNYKLRKILAGT